MYYRPGFGDQDMKSVRLDKRLDAGLREAARASGRSESEIIREAIRAYCEKLLGRRLDLRLRDVVGIAASGGGDSRQTGRDFAELLDARPRRRSTRGRRDAR